MLLSKGEKLKIFAFRFRSDIYLNKPNLLNLQNLNKECFKCIFFTHIKSFFFAHSFLCSLLIALVRNIKMCKTENQEHLFVDIVELYHRGYQKKEERNKSHDIC